MLSTSTRYALILVFSFATSEFVVTVDSCLHWLSFLFLTLCNAKGCQITAHTFVGFVWNCFATRMLVTTTIRFRAHMLRMSLDWCVQMSNVFFHFEVHYAHVIWTSTSPNRRGFIVGPGPMLAYRRNQLHRLERSSRRIPPLAGQAAEVFFDDLPLASGPVRKEREYETVCKINRPKLYLLADRVHG